MSGIANYLYIGIVLAIGFFWLIGGIRLVPEYQRLVVFRLGRPLDKPKGPGLAFLIPGIDRAVTVDLREKKREVFSQEATTKDFIPVSVDFRFYYKVLDPIKAVVTVGNSEATSAGIISTKLRTEVHGISSIDLLSEQGRISYELLENDPRFHEVCERLGLIVTNFEILKLAIDDRRKEIDDANAAVGTWGETQTTVDTTGTIILGDRIWNDMSDHPIAPKTKVRVKRVVLDIEEDTST
jgi:regulator of protease activity HflC (stomatin/prohibitin superfamily)